ncbi:MAG: hypothetical protein IT261_14265, partial [Saprospiraceae bacterium]|nr:hypothetical protein [Saprospiraceae bacterium]
MLNSLTPSSGSGLLAVGATGNMVEAIVVKFDLSGNILWKKLPGDKLYLVVGPKSGGGFLAGGSSADGKAALVHLDNNGNLIARNTYMAGSCAQFMELPDGTMVIGASTGSPAENFLFKTDASGQYTTESSFIRNRNRELRFGDFSLNQIPSSTLFFDNSRSAFSHIPSDMASTIFSHSLWVGAKDTSGFLKVSASDYREPQSDFRLGHMNSIVSDFNRLWAVSKQQIQSLRLDFLDNGVLDEMPPYDLLTWPARGNVHFRFNPDFTRVSTKLDSLPAPFVDANSDGIYNVYDGDYPVMKGDQMLWWVYNDQTEHELSFSFPLGLDLAVSLYAFDCDESEVVAQSLFADYQLINRSSHQYVDTYVGFHTDLDLGCFEDDYVGSLPEEHTYYVYNQDEVDGVIGDTCSFGTSFGSSIPVQSVTFLNQSLDHMLYFHDHEPGTNPPSQDP